MLVIIPYRGKIDDTTELAIASERLHKRTNDPPYRPDPLEIELRGIECLGPHDYSDLLNRLWREGNTFILNEHDVAPWPGGLTQLWECDEPWCLIPILVHGARNETNFGCNKFSSSFLNMTKGIFNRYPRNDIFDWRSVDTWFFQKMREDFKLKAHIHNPMALHCNWSHL